MAKLKVNSTDTIVVSDKFKAEYAKFQDSLDSQNANGMYRNMVPEANLSVREGFDQTDFDYFRPGEQLPTESRAIIVACMQAYERFGIVRNIIDLMSDFAVKGIDVVHKSASIEKFGKDWFAKVNGPERSERILNMLFRSGQVVLRRKTAKIPEAKISSFYKASAKTEIFTTYKLAKNEIPSGYGILDPRLIIANNTDEAALLDDVHVTYSIEIPKKLKHRIIKNVAKTFEDVVPLDPNKTCVIFYKKDDFQTWATPLLYPLLGHLKLYDKLMLADLAALDGVISHVRLWNIGSLEHEILPNEGSVALLSNMLLNNVGGGSMDLIWGPDLTMTETSSDIAQFLGEEKYASTLQAIFQGLGVPSTLAGSGDGGLTGNFMGLKVLVDRLEYGRMILKQFWTQEFDLLRKTFGFRDKFEIVFEDADLTDDSSLKKLYMDMADRDYISLEFLQERVGAIPEIERMRLSREAKMREKGKLPKRAGPYHSDSQQKNILERSLVNRDLLTPQDVGFDSTAPTIEEKLKQEKKTGVAAPKADKQKNGDGGRPPGVKDETQRKQKRTSLRTTAYNWAYSSVSKIDKVLLPFFNATSIKSIPKDRISEYYDLTVGILNQYEMGATVDEAGIKKAIANDQTSLPNQPEGFNISKKFRASVYVNNILKEI